MLPYACSHNTLSSFHDAPQTLRTSPARKAPLWLAPECYHGPRRPGAQGGLAILARMYSQNRRGRGRFRPPQYYFRAATEQRGRGWQRSSAMEVCAVRKDFEDSKLDARKKACVPTVHTPLRRRPMGFACHQQGTAHRRIAPRMSCTREPGKPWREGVTNDQVSMTNICRRVDISSKIFALENQDGGGRE